MVNWDEVESALRKYQRRQAAWTFWTDLFTFTCAFLTPVLIVVYLLR